MTLVTAASMRELDRMTIQDVGIPGIVLMEAAGAGCARFVATDMLAQHLNSVVVLCGPGNNGGDGFVIARHLADQGFAVTVAVLSHTSTITGDPLICFKTLSSFPIRIVTISDSIPLDLFTGADCIVDAVFGTGLTRPVEGVFAQVIKAANAAQAFKVSVDVPSGVCSDTGRLLGIAFKANLTVTFGAAKVGLFVHPGHDFAGRIEVVPIGIPASAIAKTKDAQLLCANDVLTAFPSRPADAFKNRFGHLLVVGGMRGKTGASLLAGMAAVRCGAGLVTLAIDRGPAMHVQGRYPELMVEGPFRETDNDVEINEPEFEAILAGKTAVAIGPGLSRMPKTSRILEMVLQSGLPVVLDADALNRLAMEPDRAWNLGPRCLLTPHPGEAARILGQTTEQVQNNRVQAVRDLATWSNATVVLKGAGSLVAAPDRPLGVNDTGGPALAKAGSGDVLTGMAGALLARGLLPWDAAVAAVHLHGLAGDCACEHLTDWGVSATDVIAALPKTLASLGVQ